MGQVACLCSVQCSAKEIEPAPTSIAPTIRKERLSEQFSKEFIPSAPEGTNAKLPLSTL